MIQFLRKRRQRPSNELISIVIMIETRLLKYIGGSGRMSQRYTIFRKKGTTSECGLINKKCNSKL